MRKSTTFFASVLFLAAACSSPPMTGGLRLVAVDDTGAPVTSRDARFDFGLVPRGTERTLPLVVQNAGSTPLTLTGFTFVSGDAVSAKPGVDAPAPFFSVDMTPGLRLQPGSQREYALHFTPPANAMVGSAFESVVALQATTEAGEETARLTFSGIAVDDDPCALPGTLDFGQVARGGEGRQHFTIANPGPRARAVTVGAPISLTGDDAFRVAPGSPLGEVTLAPGESRDVTVRFLPAESRAYAGRLSVTQPGCAERTVKLAGEGVDEVLECTGGIDFGFALPGHFVERGFSCRNFSFEPVVLTSLATLDGSVPSNAFSIPSGATTLTIPPGTRGANGALAPGEASLGVRFSPTVSGPRAGTLRASAPTTSGAPSVVVPLRGEGGGADVAVTPSPTVDFGEVAYFPLATPPSSAAMRLEVRNVGVLPSPADVQANLKLGVPDGLGFRRPYWQVTASNGAQVSELCIGDFDVTTGACLDDLSPSEYDPSVGLEARASAVLSIPLHVTPVSLGQKAWTVELFTNDPDEPVVTLSVTANVVSLPPCNARVSVPALHFGVIEPGQQRELAVRIENLGTQPGEACVVSGLALDPEVGRPAGVPPVFSLVSPPQSSVRLQPGEVLEVPVRAAPLTDQWPSLPTPPPTSVTGALRLALSNPTGGAAVSLFADVGRGCLVVHSEDVDFGAQAPSCRSGSRDVTVYNRCTSSVTLTQLGLQMAAGRPAASGPACPGPTPCPEYALANLPTLPVALAPGASPLTLQVEYRPIDTGEDLGLLLLQVQENFLPREYAVTLHGRGEPQGVNVESFTLPAKADVLLVVDASSSMSSKRQSVGSNFPSFIQFAQQQRVDFRVGVTLADPSNGLVRSTSTGERVLTPATVNADQVFAQWLNPSSSLSNVSSCVMPAAAAVSWPLAVQPNGNLGVFRRDASLAVVCVTDAADQALAPWWTYAEALRRGRPANQVSYSVIGPFLPSAPTGCTYRGTNTGVHAGIVGALGGATEDVCTPDWSQVMQRVGQVAFGARETFFLTARPDPMSAALDVKVDGVVAPASAWAYDAVTNAVRFTNANPVLPGQSVEVRYQVACVP